MTTADGFPAHVPVQVGGDTYCSTMCDHPGIVRSPDHQTAVDSWAEQARRVRGTSDRGQK